MTLQPVSSFDTLVSAVISIAEDDSDELREYIPIAINNAEKRLLRELDGFVNVYSSTISVAASTTSFSKPSGHKITKRIEYVDPTNAERKNLVKQDESYLNEYWPVSTSVGTPKYYSEDNLDTFRIAPCCSASSNITVVGMRGPTALSESNSTNAYTQECPDALFFATMIEVAMWQRNDVLKQDYAQMYTSTRDAINNQARRQRRDDASAKHHETPNTLSGQGES